MELYESLTKLYYSYNKNANTQIIDEELTISGFQYLMAVYDTKEITITKLATLLNYKKASVTPMVTTLVNKGYLQKIENPQDSRSKFLELTVKGLQLMESEDNFYRESIKSVRTLISAEEFTQLEKIVEKIARGMEEHDSK